MSDKLDLMIEMDAERQWEEENPPAPANPIESLSVEERINAYASMSTARFILGTALKDISEACDVIKNTPQGDKLAGMHDQLSDFLYDLKMVEREVWRCKDND